LLFFVENLDFFRFSVLINYKNCVFLSHLKFVKQYLVSFGCFVEAISRKVNLRSSGKMRWQGLYKFQIKFALAVVLLITLHPVCSSGGHDEAAAAQHHQHAYKPTAVPPNLKPVATPPPGMKVRSGGDHNMPSKSSYAMLSEAMSQAVNHEFSE
jgi:hypothetical protein